MRPLRLEFQAFGSFPGKEVVDFEVLGHRGLFVVTGPTGAGKTTVFDAMGYALYGVLPGGRSADGDPRSHHAAVEVETYAELLFEVDGQRYLVRRSPAQLRPKLRGDGTTAQAAAATLVKVHGAQTEIIATKVGSCTTTCTELVGLDARQFQRVVLLPQGKFTDFLIATDEDRERLLRQLFGGELFETATRLLKEQMLELEQQVAGVDQEVRRHRANADEHYQFAHDAWMPEPARPGDVEALTEEELRAAVAVLEPARVANREAVAALQRDATAAAERKATAEQQARLFDDAMAARTKLAMLHADAEAVAERADAVEASRRARPVTVQHRRATRAAATAESAAVALAEVYATVERGFITLARPVPAQEPAAVAAAVQAADHEFAAQRQLWHATQDAITKANQAAAAHARAEAEHAALLVGVADVQFEITLLRDKIAALEPTVAQIAPLEVARDAAHQRLSDRVALDAATAALAAAHAGDQDARADYEHVMARFVATQAPRLAAALVPDAPCPVCGSVDHPDIATAAVGDVVDHVAVDAARAIWSSASARVATCTETVASLHGVLGPHARTAVSVLQSGLEDAEVALKLASRAADELATSRVDLDERMAIHVAVDSGGARRRQSIGRAVRSRHPPACGSRSPVARRGGHRPGCTGDGHLDRPAAADRRGVAALAGGSRHHRHHATARGAPRPGRGAGRQRPPHRGARPRGRHRRGRGDRFGAADHPLARRPRRHHRTRPHARGAGCPRHASRGRCREGARPSRRHRGRHRGAGVHHGGELVGRCRPSPGRRRWGGGRLHRAAPPSRRRTRIVFRTCNGEAGMRVKLERWVLAGELDRVTNAANAHLARMTNHRYRLHRSAGSKGGLTLEVFDAHTGRARATASLSGGEQFQASLSLALGLADVVSHGGTASGKQFEALFVDEGFGSLDPDALDDAINALTQLQAAGRMVGAITHVEAMQQQLHVGIEVRSLADGRGSTLTVHP